MNSICMCNLHILKFISESSPYSYYWRTLQTDIMDEHSVFHNTRSKYDLHTQIFYASLFQKSVINMGVKLCMYLPSKIKKLENFNWFGKKWNWFCWKTHFTHLKSFINRSQCSNTVKYCLWMVGQNKTKILSLFYCAVDQ
jgi:hypothetical protein